MKPVVYTGTSISHSEARAILDAEYLPPVKRNDIKRLIKFPPEIIGIIDGVFFDSAAVAHREIIEALRMGITVVGGGSMGALRAFELEPYGMTGVGEIYEMYRNGVLESDDEVAVTFDDGTLEPLSIPLVNVRMTVKRGREMGILTEEQATAVVDIAKKIFYPERNYRNIINKCVNKGIFPDSEKEKMFDFFKKHEVDVKRKDAVLVLEKIKELSLR